jgi:hypothetical protein
MVPFWQLYFKIAAPRGAKKKSQPNGFVCDPKLPK